MSEIKIIPTVMPETYEDFIEKINRVSRLTETIQIDVMDGKFVPSKSWPYNFLNDEYWRKLLTQEEGLPHWEKNNFEIDLMVSDQISEATNWIDIGVFRIIGHLSAFKNNEEIEKFINLGREREVEVFLALNPNDSNTLLDKWIEKIDGVQFMGITKVGYQGQEFAKIVLTKIAEFHNQYPHLPISVDGGVNFETARLLVIAGATSLASGSVIFNSSNPQETIQELKKVAQGE